MRVGKVLLGILAALGVGTLLGVLFAPDKGTETRKKITKKTNEFSEELNAKVTEAVSSVNEKMETLKDEASRMAANIKQRKDEAMAEFNATEKAKMN